MNKYQENACCGPKYDSPIRTTNMDDAISQISEQVTEAEECLKHLQDRLSRVLAPVPGCDKAENKPEPTMAPIPAKIRDLANRLRYANKGIQSLLLNLEV